MALPTVADVKAYLRIETSTEDALLGSLLAAAVALCERYTDVPLTVQPFAFTDSQYGLNVGTVILSPNRPVGVPTSIVDGHGNVVDVTGWSVNPDAGIICPPAGVGLGFPPYTVVTTYGLPLWSKWPSIEPMFSQMVLDLCADLYERRTPGASSETAAGTTVSWDFKHDTVARVEKMIRALKLPVAI